MKVEEDELVDDSEAELPGGAPELDPPAGEKKDDDKDKDKSEAVDPKEFKQLQKDLKAARTLARENEQAAQFWADKAKNGGEKPAAAAAAADDDDLDIDLVSEISTNGVKGLKSVLKRLGVATLGDVDARINNTRGEITEQAELLRQFPELGDQTSPLFRATAQIYNSLKTDPALAKSPKLIALSARMAKAELATGHRRRSAPADDGAEEVDNDNDEQQDDERTERIARQSGDRGRGDRRSSEPDTLSPLQASIVARFAAVGAPVTTESFMKRAKLGVRRGGGR